MLNNNTVKMKSRKYDILPHELKVDDNTLQLLPIKLTKKYCKKWNVESNEFYVLAKNGVPINDSIYRVGGLGVDMKQDYFMLIKYVEAVYDLDFIKKCYPKKTSEDLELVRYHLDGLNCIFDKYGNEKKVFDRFKSPNLISGSCVYFIDDNYYNIETDELYCRAYKSMVSSDFIFLENHYDKDLSKRGVMLINKKDGRWSVFS